MDRDRNDYRCSFCNKPRSQVHHLFGGSDGVFICDECVALTSSIVADERTVATHTRESARSWRRFWRR